MSEIEDLKAQIAIYEATSAHLKVARLRARLAELEPITTPASQQDEQDENDETATLPAGVVPIDGLGKREYAPRLRRPRKQRKQD